MIRFLVGAAGILTAVAFAAGGHGRATMGALLILWLASRGRRLTRAAVKRQEESEALIGHGRHH